METITHSDKETMDFGKKIAHDLRGGDVLCLYGELGAGKTTLVKGIAQGLGVEGEITSPTFTLMNVYKTPLLTRPLLGEEQREGYLVHIDTYRLKNERELLDIGAEDYIGQPYTITIIEWPEKIENLLKNKKISKIFIEHSNKKERKISLKH